MSKSKTYMRVTIYEPNRCVFPAFVQPKHNGVRFLFNGDIAKTREENLHCPHIQKMIAAAWPNVSDGWTIDGEACFPLGSGYSLQQAQSAVKREQELSKKLIFPVFDGFNMDIPYEPLLEERLLTVGADCEIHRVTCLAEVDHWYKKWLADGHEGLIFRTNSAYRLGSALDRVMKRKPVKHQEYVIAAVWEGKGKNAGTPVYRLWRPGHYSGESVDKKTTFGACPDGPYEGKREMWEERHNAVGKLLTIRFWDKYDSGVPQFPIAEAVRDYE